jgi:hypothetical protein
MQREIPEKNAWCRNLFGKSPSSSNALKKVRSFLHILPVFLLIGWSIQGTRGTWHAIRCPEDPAVQTLLGRGDNADAAGILRGVRKKRTFLATFTWWKSNWCHEAYPYYRPLTSQLFWLQYRLFGEDLPLWTLTGAVLHVVTVVTAYLTFSVLTGSRWIAFIATAVFGGPPFSLWTVRLTYEGFTLAPIWTIGGPQLASVSLWINEPEYWCAITLFLGMVALNARRYFATLLCLILCIGAKELGLLFLPAMVIVAWYRRVRAPLWFWIAGVLLTMLLFVIRFLFVTRTMGLEVINPGAAWRALVYYTGVLGVSVGNRDWQTLLLTTLLLLIWWGAKKLRGSVLVAIPIFLLLAVMAWMNFIVWNWAPVVIALLPFFFFVLWRYYRREAVFFAAEAVLFSAPLYLRHVGPHAWYVADIFKTGLFAVAVTASFQHVRRAMAKCDLG